MYKYLLIIIVSMYGYSSIKASDPYPYPNHVHTMKGVRVYEENGKPLISTSIVFTTMGQTGTGKAIDSVVFDFTDPSTPLYINGTKYDYENRVIFSDPQASEIERWWCGGAGYFSITKRNNGGYNFDTIEGREEKILYERNIKYIKNIPYLTKDEKDAYEIGWKERGHSGATKVRIKTMEECRKLWRKELTGEVIFDIKKQIYVDVPVSKRKPLLPMGFDPRSLPLIKPEV